MRRFIVAILLAPIAIPFLAFATLLIITGNVALAEKTMKPVLDLEDFLVN